MSTVAQIYNIINEVAKQTFGETAIIVVDTSTFISLGDKVLSSATDTDLFTNTLVDRIGRTIFSVRRYQTRNMSMVRHSFEYGAIVQKMYVDLPEAKENNSWRIGDESYKPEFAPVIKPTVRQKFFNKLSTWEIDVTIPDFMLRTAFLNETQMAVFIDAIFTAMDNMMEVALENNADLIRASFIARKLKGAKPCGAINLLKEYNTQTNAGLTVASALRNQEFLRWASMQILLWKKRMEKMSSLFNEESGFRRHTPSSDLVINVLQDFAAASNTYLQSDTYHNELTALPNYEQIPYWQASGTTFAFEDTSKIHVQFGDSAETDVVEQSGIIAVMYDYEAMGITLTDRRSATERNNHDEYTNYYNKATFGMFNDMSENGIVFYMAES